MAKTARMAPSRMKASGTPVTPVAAYAVVTTPATTVRGAAAEMTKKTTDGMPRRPPASAAETATGPCSVWDIWGTPEGWGVGSPVVF
jgi:hypothetical protein